MNSDAEPEKPRFAQLFAFSPIIRRFFRLLRTAEDVHPRLLVFGIINAVPRLRAAPCSPQISQRPRRVSMSKHSVPARLIVLAGAAAVLGTSLPPVAAHAKDTDEPTITVPASANKEATSKLCIDRQSDEWGKI